MILTLTEKAGRVENIMRTLSRCYEDNVYEFMTYCRLVKYSELQIKTGILLFYPKETFHMICLRIEQEKTTINKMVDEYETSRNETIQVEFKKAFNF